MMNRRYYLQFLTLAFLLLVNIAVYAQKERKFIRRGNDLYEKAIENSDSTGIDSVNFVNAEIEYRKALEKKPNDMKAVANIGNAQFKQQKFAEAASQYEHALNVAESKEDKAKAYFNYGNAMLGQQKLEESIEAYKNALRNNPSDLEAKYNLEFARKMKEKQDQQQQQQQQNQDQNQDQNKDQNKDQDKNKDQNQDQNKDQNDQNKDQQNKQNKDQNKDQNKEQQQQQPKISKQNAEQMLKALENDEKETQEKVKKAKAEKAKSSKPDIDW